MKPYAPDINDPFPRPRDNGGGNNDGGGHRGGYPNAPRVLSPAETRALAEGMSDEFGGSVKSWKRDLNWQPKQYNFGGGHGGGHGNRGGNNQPGGVNPTGPNHPQPGFDPTSPLSRMAPSFPMQGQQPQAPQMGQQPMSVQAPPMASIGPGMLAASYPRDRGLLGVPANEIPSQQRQDVQPPRGLVGDLPPAVLAYIRGRGI